MEGDTAVPPSSLVTMDVEKKKGVYDFMVRVGWVSPLGREERTRGGRLVGPGGAIAHCHGLDGA
jgi:hypothetical protein